MKDARLPGRLRPVPILLLIAGLTIALLGGLASGRSSSAAETAPAGPAVYVIPAKQNIENGLYAFLKRAYGEAESAKAERIVLEIDTLGGLVTTAGDIGRLIRESKVPTTAFVRGKAVSAGTYIALNADQIVMQPSSSIGAAAVVDGSGELVDNPKIVSYWTSEMMNAAKLNGRDPAIAAAMVDPGQAIDLPKLGKKKNKGEILTLSTDEAVKAGYADHVASSVEETIEWLGLQDRQVVTMSQTPAERIAGWLTRPDVMTVLLIVGIAGIAIELLVPGFGVPGIAGLIAFGLYFFGHYIAGFAGAESIALFAAGVVLLILEVFVPSFGILGILGVSALAGGVVTAAFDTGSALQSLLFAFVIAALLTAIAAKAFHKRGVWNRFILRDRFTKEEGYIPAPSKETLLGQEGESLTPLRPAGTALIGGERVDVVTSGGFIAAGRRVKVLKVEGTRVVVGEVQDSV